MLEMDVVFMQENLSMALTFKSISSTASMAHCRKANERLLRVFNRSKTGFDSGNQFVPFGKLFSEIKKLIPKANQRLFKKVQFGYANPELHDSSSTVMKLKEIEEAIDLVRQNASSLLGIEVDLSQITHTSDAGLIIQNIIREDLDTIGISSDNSPSQLTFDQESVVDDVLHIVDAAEEIGVVFDSDEYLDIGRAAEIRGNLFSAERYYREVLKHCQKVRDVEGEIDALTHMASIAFSRGDLDELNRLHNKILAQSEEVGYNIGKIIAHLGFGIRHYEMGQLDEAEESYRVSQNLLDGMDDEIIKATLMLNTSLIQVISGDLNLAEKMVRNALEIFQQEESLIHESKAWSHLSSIRATLGFFAEALELNLKNLERKREVEDAIGVAGMLMEIGGNYEGLHELETAKDYYTQSLKLSRKIGHRKVECASLGNLGTIHEKQCDYHAAEGYYIDSLQIAREVQNAGYAVNCLINLGILCRKWKDYDKSKKYLLEALEISSSSGLQLLISSCHHSLGIVYRESGDLKKSVDYLRKSITANKSSKLSFSVARSQRNLALTYQELGESDNAIKLLKESILTLQEGGRPRSLCIHLRSLARVYADQSDYTMARKALMESLDVSVSIDDKQSEALCYHELGFLEWKFGNNGNEEEYYLRCLEINQEGGFLLGEADVLRDMSRNAKRDDLLEKSTNLLEKCNSIRVQIGLDPLDS